jgi:hypothetical protein
MNKIEGIPDGWELVRIGVPLRGEFKINYKGEAIESFGNEIDVNYPIVRKIEQPKHYRPFANAEEFKPYRDKWWYRGDQDGRVHFPPAAYCDKYHGGLTFVEKLNTCFFEDGVPFGIEINDN